MSEEFKAGFSSSEVLKGIFLQIRVVKWWAWAPYAKWGLAMNYASQTQLIHQVWAPEIKIVTVFRYLMLKFICIDFYDVISRFLLSFSIDREDINTQDSFIVKNTPLCIVFQPSSQWRNAIRHGLSSLTCFLPQCTLSTRILIMIFFTGKRFLETGGDIDFKANSLPKNWVRFFIVRLHYPIAGFHMTSLNFKLQNWWSCWYFTWMRYKSSWKLIFTPIFVPNGFLVLR